MTIEDIAQQITTCQKCDLAKTRTQAVPGEGNPQTEIMFIGEAPGEEEDKQGKPFVGEAGKLLDELLAVAGLKRKDIFITNLIKCRPPGNRDPEATEIKTCWPFLEQQIELIKPKLIVLLGRHAMAKFLPKNFKISQVHGQPKRMIDIVTDKKQVYYPVYHPAAALYHTVLKNDLIRDFKRLPLVLKKVKESQ